MIKINPYEPQSIANSFTDSHQTIRQHALDMVGVFDRVTHLPFDVLWKNNWNDEFESLVRKGCNSPYIDMFFKAMRLRLCMGKMRYGHRDGTHYQCLQTIQPNGNLYDLYDAFLTKFSLWSTTNNDEYLVDAANYCLLMYVFPENKYPGSEYLIMRTQFYINAFNPENFHPSDRND